MNVSGTLPVRLVNAGPDVALSDVRTVLPYTRSLRRGGHASASGPCRPTEVQGYRPPARCSILRTAMTDTRIVTTVPPPQAPPDRSISGQ